MRRKRKKNKSQKCLLYVEVRNNNYEKGISEFKKRVKNSGLLLELRNREFYEKKSAEKRRKKKLAILRNKVVRD
tara:strand:+ start:701 stop:922 length:222 start_codon:yes stop_codon:yes gene_type:complete